MANYSGIKNNSPFSSSGVTSLYEKISFDTKNNFFITLSGEVADDNVPVNSKADVNQLIDKLALISKINESDVSLVTQLNRWVRGKVFWSWRSSGQPQGNIPYFCFEEKSGLLQMMIRGSSNPFWRSDYEGKSATTSSPNKTGTNEYSDGSIWTTLCLVPPSKQLKFLDKYCPITTINNEARLLNFNTATDKSTEASIKCLNGSSVTGTCCLYHKESGYDPVTGITYQSGNFYKCDCTKCYRCIDLANRLNMEYIFNHHGLTGATADTCLGCDQENYPTTCGPCPCNITSKTPINKLKEKKVSSGKPADSAETFTKLLNTESTGEIISMFVDLSGISRNNLKLRGTNPSNWILTFSSTSGVGADWRIAYEKDGKNTYYMVGLTKISGGNGYLDIPNITNLDSILENNGILTADRFNINVTPIGGISSSITTILPTRVQIRKSFRTSELKAAGINIPKITRVGIAEKITINNGFNDLATDTNPNQPITVSATIKIIGQPIESYAPGDKELAKGKATTITSSGSPLVFSSTPLFAYSSIRSDGRYDVTLYCRDLTSAKSIKNGDIITDSEGNQFTVIGNPSIPADPRISGSIIDIDSGTYHHTSKVNIDIPESSIVPDRRYTFVVNLGPEI